MNKKEENNKIKYDDVEQKPVKPTEGDDILVIDPNDKQENIPKFDKVVSGEVTIAPKKRLLERFIVALIGPDGVRGIFSYLGREIVTPAVKNIIVDSIESGVRMAVYKDDVRDYRSGGYSGQAAYGRQPANRQYGPSKSYDKAYGGYSGSRPPEKRDMRGGSMRPGGKSYVDSYVIHDRQEAIYVLKTLRDHIYTYGSVSLADYYDLIGVDSDYTNYNYGWTNLVDVTIKSARNGYIIDFPEVEVV